MRVLAIDFETADTLPDSACALGAVLIEDGEVADQYYRLIRPPRQRVLFTHIHGLSWNHVADAPSFGEVFQELAWLFHGVDAFAAHHASFDRGVLEGGCAAYGWQAPERPWICTVKLARAAWDIRPTKLPDVCDHFGIELKHHDAMSDALACARIAQYALDDGHDLEIGMLTANNSLARFRARW